MSSTVVSLALFRHPNSQYEHPNCGIKQGSFYRAYLPSLIRAYRHVYPGWEIRIHHDGNVFAGFYGAQLRALGAAGIVRLVDCGEAKQLCEAMLWRLLPLSDPQVEVFVCRDVDTCPTFRERAAVEEWLASSAAVHAMADSAVHSVPLMGGMIGFKRQAVLEILGGQAPRPSGDLNTHGSDQVWLNNELWPRVSCATFSHRWHGRHWSGEFKSASSVTGWNEVDPIGACCPHIGAAYPIDPVDAYLRGFPDREVEKAEQSVQAEQKFVVLSSDKAEMYAFFLPIAARLWKSAIGYSPFAFLVGEFREWLDAPRLRLVYGELQKLDARISFLGTPARHRSSTVAQCARLYAGDLLGDNDWAITADVDMWPLSRSWFQPQSFARWCLWYSNAYGGQRWPLCYLGAPVAQWRAVMGQHVPGQTLLGRITEQLDAGLGGDEDGWKAWNYDEDLFAHRFKHAGVRGYQEVPRHGGPPNDRIDRSRWPREIRTLEGKVDAHVLRPGPENWDRLRPIVGLLLSAEEADAVDRYVEAWRASST